MGNDQLSFLQELVGDADALAEQSTGITAQIENQALQIAKLIERLRDFVLRGLIESVDAHVADAGTNQEVNVDTVAWNLVADQRELPRLLHARPRDTDVNRRAL